MRLLPILASVHTVYYGITGLWPLVHIRSFMAITGPKTDLWLVRTVGLLVTAIALALVVSWWRGTYPLELVVLLIAAAVALAAIDVIYWARGIISKIYLADALAELVLVFGWLVLWNSTR